MKIIYLNKNIYPSNNLSGGSDAEKGLRIFISKMTAYLEDSVSFHSDIGILTKEQTSDSLAKEIILQKSKILKNTADMHLTVLRGCKNEVCDFGIYESVRKDIESGSNENQ